MTHLRPCSFALCLALAFVLSGCSPLSLTIGLGPADQKLRETEVLSDKGEPSDKVALIDVRGLIADAPRPGLFGSGTSPVDDLVARLAKAEGDPSVKAVVLRINSPGGTVSASDTMYREVRRFAETTGKPVVASMGEVAASGGYYLALAADEIVAQPTTLTGSIGVIIPTLNVSDGLSRIGIRSRAITSGPNKDLANPLEPIREEQYAVLEGIVDEFYARFRAVVLERRPGLAPESVEPATDGRIVTGAHAVEIGLVDREGNIREAFAAAKALANLESAVLVKYHDSHGHPRSAYASAASAAIPADGYGSPAGETELNFLQIQLGTAPLSTAGVYYLWLPAAP